MNSEKKEPSQQKGRRIPLQLQNAVKAEIDKLLKEGHIRKVDKISDEVFIQPVLVTVKKDKTVKIALDSRALNNAILKEKYQMLNLDNLMEQVAEIINGGTEGEVRFTSLDMQYAYGQTELHPDPARHCNFQIIGGRATGTYAFNTGFYGLIIMPPPPRVPKDNGSIVTQISKHVHIHRRHISCK